MPADHSIIASIVKVVAPALRARVVVRHATPDRRTGRCLFRLAGHAADKIVVAVVMQDGRPSGQYYVLAARQCPAMLLVRPGGRQSKWSGYACTRPQLAALVASTAQQVDRARPAVLARLA